MGLFSTRRTNHCSISFVPRLLILLAFCVLILLLHLEVDNFATQTKTLVGHNLEPAPWQLFDLKSLDDESRYSRASKFVQCNYLSCGTSKSTLPQLKHTDKAQRQAQCPEFFNHIHRDLEPWMHSKITLAHLMEAKKFATFRVVIIGGKLYADLYYACTQSRAMFTVWGFLQLLRRYPGRVPDVDLMFECMDKPSINRTEHVSMPLPLFRYCTTSQHFDIPFPDWSFWGWSEINISPWDEEFQNIKKGSNRKSWNKKKPFAYWKGNPDVASPIRMELLQCNDTKSYKAQIFRQDWGEAAKGGFKNSKLSKQCDYRWMRVCGSYAHLWYSQKDAYKIYAEGYAWSVSLKYILSCGSLPLIISPQYEDFFTRGLVPKKNYWPVSSIELCQAIKSSVDWADSHPLEAETIGRAAQDFMGSLSMDRVYDYMFHLLSEYSKLQAFTPVRPSSASEVCEESVLCFADEIQRQMLQKSTSVPSSTPPCTIPPLHNH